MGTPDKYRETFVATTVNQLQMLMDRGEFTNAANILINLENKKIRGTLLKILITRNRNSHFQNVKVLISELFSAGHFDKDVLLLIGRALIDLGIRDLAVDVLKHAEKAFPEDPEVLNYFGVAQKVAGYFWDARKTFNRCLEIRPSYPEALNNLASVCKDMLEGENALALLEKAATLDPRNRAIQSNLISLSNYSASRNPIDTLNLAASFQSQLGDPAIIRCSYAMKPADGDLRLGFVSGDFKAHPVGYFLRDILKSLTENNVEIFLYSSTSFTDELTRELRNYTRCYFDISLTSDIDAAKLISSHKLDTLIDLSGYTAGERLGLFRHRPAPTQGTWLGYCGTLAIPEIEFIIADDYVIPPNHEKQYSEHVLRIPGCYLSMDPASLPGPNEIPSSILRPTVFGAFNNSNKLNDELLNTWAEILCRTPESTLLLKNPALSSVKFRQQMATEFMKRGISPERLRLTGHFSRVEHHQSFSKVDIMLDTFPYNGVTSTFEALRNVVPIITLTGDRFISRNGLSILMNAGIPNLVTASSSEYVERAIQLARDVRQRANVKEQIFAAQKASCIFDTKKFSERFKNTIVKYIESGSSKMRVKHED